MQKGLEFRSSDYESEEELESALIDALVASGDYERLETDLNSKLKDNLRLKLGQLNGCAFSDAEWGQIEGVLFKRGERARDKTYLIQENYIQTIIKDDGTTQNIKIIDKKDLAKNSLQIARQVSNERNRYDVVILVNGIPLVLFELKRRGVRIREAFEQISRYRVESLNDSELFLFVQIFIISNGTNTKYYSNSTKNFEFTSSWSDHKNEPKNDLESFCHTFMAKERLLSVLTKYCVFTSNRELLVMRPYQIFATEAIIERIKTSKTSDLGSIKSGGYVWHTTGSGKTLTSFKTAQLASSLREIDKVLFVVDRKDLDYQTINEYEKFQKGAANGNISTKILKRQLEDDSASIIVTTIQKLSRFINSEKNHKIYFKRVVMIFDECHRSQFGKMHRDITKNFKRYHIFGFTGTPIFEQDGDFKTTAQIFGQRLHAYTLINAISDKNVLPFRVDYVDSMKAKDNIKDERVLGIDTKEAYESPRRIEIISEYILRHFNQKTKNRRFNSMLAVSNIQATKEYYKKLRRDSDLKIALIYSSSKEVSALDSGLDEEEIEGVGALLQSDRDFLIGAIDEYNRAFGTNFSSDGDGFASYYKDISQRVKSGEINLLIVVNMFLTGFDAPCLNTLWVDKPLQQHGLIQAFSRTNRIKDSIKGFGNIVCFRPLDVDNAIVRFGSANQEDVALSVALIGEFDKYYYGDYGYEGMINELLEKYPPSERIEGERNKRAFIKLMNKILRTRNIIEDFDEFVGREILSEGQWQDYKGIYVDIKDTFTPRKRDKTSIVEDLEFEIELISQNTYGVDEVRDLIIRYWGNDNKERARLIIQRALLASPVLKSKKELILKFLQASEPGDFYEQWREFIREQREIDLKELILSEQLDEEKVRQRLKEAFSSGELRLDPQKALKLMTKKYPLGDRDRQAAIERLIEKTEDYYSLYADFKNYF